MEYSEFVNSRKKDAKQVIYELSPLNADLLHMAVGISGEAGELLDAIKKAAIYNKPLDIENVIEELGDLEFYMQGLRSALGLKRDDIIQKNIEKLSERYSSGSFSNEEAQERADKDGNLWIKWRGMYRRDLKLDDLDKVEVILKCGHTSDGEVRDYNWSSALGVFTIDKYRLLK